MLESFRKVRLVLTKSVKAESASVFFAAVLETCWQAGMEHPVFLGSYWELGMEHLFGSGIETVVSRGNESRA